MSTAYAKIDVTTKRNVPAVLVTPEDVTQEVSAPMCSKSIPLSTVESMRYPSAPVTLVRSLTFHPADSFKLLPVVELSDGFMYTPMCKEAPLAPAILHIEKLRSGYIGSWHIVRCPYCGGTHQHGANDGGYPTKSAGEPESLSNLGGRLAHCHPDDETYRGEYRLIGVSNPPNNREMDRYFPLLPSAPRKRRDTSNWAVGCVYFIKSGSHYKIGISTAPDKRIKSLQTASPEPIEVIHLEFTDDYVGLENRLHRMYTDYRTQGEWFSFPEWMIDDVIAAMKGGAV